MKTGENYDNSTYWVDIHNNFHGLLRAVGWPTLSEEFNKLKYESEARSFVELLRLALSGEKSPCVLEVGVGIGYWTSLQIDYFRQLGLDGNITALDISPSALELVKTRFPQIEPMPADLKLIDVNSMREKFSLVTAVMVLLHLTDFDAYRRALEFCANSVQKGGYFILYEPVINRNYSPFSSLDYRSFDGNSIPRNGALVDNIMQNFGMERVSAIPGASWVLNSPIQGGSKVSYTLKNYIWRFLSRFVYRNDALTKRLAIPLLTIDSFLKRHNPDSGTFMLFRKLSA